MVQYFGANYIYAHMDYHYWVRSTCRMKGEEMSEQHKTKSSNRIFYIYEIKRTINDNAIVVDTC